MKTLWRFIAKFTSLIVAVLSCFNRVIFRDYLPITNGPALEGFVDHILKIQPFPPSDSISIDRPFELRAVNQPISSGYRGTALYP